MTDKFTVAHIAHYWRVCRVIPNGWNGLQIISTHSSKAFALAECRRLKKAIKQ